MAEISEYEQNRLKNIEENRRMLCQLGLLSENWKPPAFKPFTHKPVVKLPVAVRRKKSENVHDVSLPGRRSMRGSLSNDIDDGELTDSINGDYAESTSSTASNKEKLPKRPNSYGAIEGVEVGDWWETRIECSRAGIHRPTVAGIHPGPEGAYSIALSGGYEDNYDGGHSFTYTGSGGRDLKGTASNPKNLRTGPQVKDQNLDGANGALATSVESRNPVRVIRGYKSSSVYAPESGYRYDGLYQVEKYWTTKGLSGHLVYKYAFKRCLDQDPPPWETCDSDAVEELAETNAVSRASPTPADFPENPLNPFVKLGKKLNAEDMVIDDNTEPETCVTENILNGSCVNNNNNDKETSDNLDRVNKTPVKSKIDGSTVTDLPSERSLNTVGKSPKRSNSKNTPAKNRVSVKTPVKMLASNQKGDSPSSDCNKNNSHKSPNKLRAQELLTANLQKALSDCKNDLMKLGSDPIIPINKIVPDDSKVQSRVHTSPDIFDGSHYSSYYNDEKDSESKSSFLNSSIRVREFKRSPSSDDFSKICDELCNELPKIEKVKRLRFSFDHFSDNNFPIDLFKSRRKRTSRTPRRSSLNIKRPRTGDGDLIFSKYLDMWSSNFKAAVFDDWTGWDECDFFRGWTDKEVLEAKKYSASFSDFKFNTDSEENSWAGWEDDVSRRSLILNGFLLEKLSRDRCDSESIPSEFAGFKITVINKNTD